MDATLVSTRLFANWAPGGSEGRLWSVVTLIARWIARSVVLSQRFDECSESGVLCQTVEKRGERSRGQKVAD